MTKILFVCHGNICRSPMAEFVMKELVRQKGLDGFFEIASAATSREEIGNDIHYGTRQKLLAEKIPFQKRHAVQLTKKDYSSYHLLIGMDRYNLRNIARIIGSDPEQKVHLLLEFSGQNRDIADPWYSGNFDQTYEDILSGCTALLQKLIKENRLPG